MYRKHLETLTIRLLQILSIDEPFKISIEVIGQRLAGEVHIVLLGDFVILIEAIYGHVLGNVAQQNVRLRQGSSFLSINDILGNACEDSRLRGQEGYLVYAFHTQLSGSGPGLELEMVYKELVIVRKKFGEDDFKQIPDISPVHSATAERQHQSMGRHKKAIQI